MRIRVEGGHSLNGEYHPSGNSNAAIALLAASLLTDDIVILRNFPDTAVTRNMLDMAGYLGAQYSCEDHTLKIQTAQISKRTLTQEETSPLLFLASVLARREFFRLEADFPLNRIQTHLEALRDLGMDVVYMNGAVECRAAKWDYKDIILSQASVTATALVMMLAACFGKETLVYNAASEPHLQELAYMLEGMGAQVQGVGSNVLRIFGKEDLHGADVTVGPDHIEVASLAAIGALSGGRLSVTDIRQKDLRIIQKTFQRLGLNLDVDENALFVPRHEMLTISNREEDVDSSIESAPWPGFPSDLVAIATVVATQARGTSLIHEKLYNNRLIFVDKLKAMGAQIVLCDPHRAIVIGPSPLYAIYMDSPDVRTGLGMLGAALIAQGESVIDNAQVLGYTFEDVIPKLQKLGARITVETGV